MSRKGRVGAALAVVVVALFLFFPVVGVEGCGHGTDYGVCRAHGISLAGLRLQQEVIAIEVVLLFVAGPAYLGWRLDHRARARGPTRRD